MLFAPWWNADKPRPPTTLKPYFENDADLEPLGGTAYLTNLAAGVISVVNIEDYARTVYDLHLRRRQISMGNEVIVMPSA